MTKSQDAPSDGDSPVVELKGVWKTYKMGTERVEALQDANITIKRGEFVAITGTSGSGKSTALQLIGLLDRPSKGTLFVDGKRADRLSDRAQARLRGRSIGFVFQYFHLYPSLNAMDNVALPMSVLGVGRVARRKRARQLLDEVGLGSRSRHLPNELSGGQRQRVAIARALANDPEVILADEPTGNLDTNTGREIMDLLTDRHQAGTTVLIVTHDAELAARADRVITLRDGKVISDA